MASSILNLLTSLPSQLFALPSALTSIASRPMESLLSFPLLSLLLLPSVTSWSTSLNLLFFYLTWSTLLLSNPPLKVELLGTLFIRLIFFVLPSAFFVGFDGLLPSFAKKIKQHGKDAIATSEENGGAGRRGMWWKVVGLSIVNLVLSVALQTALEWLVSDVLRMRSALKITTTLPMPWGIVKDLARGYFFREVLTYLIHRYVLHNRSNRITRPVAKMHAAYYHRLPTTLPFSAHYDHPLPYFLHMFLPTYLPAAFFRFHLLTFHLFLALTSIEEALVYSGYSALPSGLILGGMARRTESHLMMGKSKGNFGCYGLADLAMGTSLGEDVVDDVTEEADRRDVSGKVKAKGKGLRKRIQKAASHDDQDTETEDQMQDDEYVEKEAPRKSGRRAATNGEGRKTRSRS